MGLCGDAAMTCIDVTVEGGADPEVAGRVCSLTVEADYLVPERGRLRELHWAGVTKDRAAYHFELPLMVLGTLRIGVAPNEPTRERFLRGTTRLRANRRYETARAVLGGRLARRRCRGQLGRRRLPTGNGRISRPAVARLAMASTGQWASSAEIVVAHIFESRCVSERLIDPPSLAAARALPTRRRPCRLHPPITAFRILPHSPKFPEICRNFPKSETGQLRDRDRAHKIPRAPPPHHRTRTNCL